MRVDTGNETINFLKARLKEASDPNRRDRVELVGLGFEWPNIGLIHNFDHLLGYNPLRLEEVVQAIGADENIAEARQRRFTPLFPSYRSIMADYLGLRYIAINHNQPIEKIDKRLKAGDLTLLANTREALIYENPHALPRVLFAFDWQPSNFTQLVRDGQWPQFDPRRTVLLEAAPPLRETAKALPVSQAAAVATLRTYQNTEVQVEVDTPRAGFLVLNDVWHPWWFGTIDGNPAPVLRANVIFRAVQVPAGRHIVRFEFKPLTGAMQQVAAILKGGSLEPHAVIPGDLLHTRPEASAQDLRTAFEVGIHTLH